MHCQVNLSGAKQPAWLQVESMVTACVNHQVDLSGQPKASSGDLAGSYGQNLFQKIKLLTASKGTICVQRMVTDQVIYNKLY